MSTLLKLLAFACFSTIVISSLIVQVDDQEIVQNPPPRMPTYIGRGYHIIYGNPKSQYGLDPGFHHPVFEYEYTKNRTTADNRFSIPDHVTSKQISLCSFSSNVSQYRGTKSYQDNLKQLANITVGHSNIQKYSFSLSRTWQRIQNSTTAQKNTLTHTSAECQTYVLQFEKFDTPELTDNFRLGAIKSHTSNKWDPFIEEFGTHYVHELTMGGRATQEIEYTHNGISLLESLNIDTSITAKASFAKFFADSSFDWGKYAKNISYSDEISTSITQQYVGGQPPKTGDTNDWLAKILENQMPISYKLLPLSNLFKNIQNATFNSTLAEMQFEEALNQYCVNRKCLDPISDFAKPKPATIILEKTPAYGSQKYHPFSNFFNSTTLNVNKIHIGINNYTRNIQLELNDGIQDVSTPKWGSSATVHSWEVPKGEYITQIQGYVNVHTSCLTFITNKGTKSPKYGKASGNYYITSIPKDYRIVGFYGTYSSYIYQLGFYIAKTVYPTRQGVQ